VTARCESGEESLESLRPRLRFRCECKDVTGRPVRAWVAQLVERVLGKDEVTGSIPVPGSTLQRAKRSRGIAMHAIEGQSKTSGGNSVVESLPSKQMVAGSSPVPRSITQVAETAVLGNSLGEM
jgi:hypothetical protein